MAYASQRTLIPLDRVPVILQINPLFFNSVVAPGIVAHNAAESIWFQHDWFDAGKASRESLARALKQAEDTVMYFLGFPLLPMWFLNEPHRLPQPAIPGRQYLSSRSVTGEPLTIQTRWGQVLAGGQRATSLVVASAPIVYSDTDADGYFETATVTTPTSVTDPEELCLFYPGKNAAEQWEIRPVTVSLAAGVATFVFRREMVVTELAAETGPNDDTGEKPILDGTDNTNFLTVADVYRVYNDPSHQLTFISRSSCLSCGGAGCVVCGQLEETGCIGLEDERTGIVSFNRATWDSTNEQFISSSFTNGRLPERCRLWYRAGMQDEHQVFPTRQMDPVWERLLVFYAVSLLDTEIGWQDNTKRIYSYWMEDFADSSGEGVSKSISPELLRNPLGTTKIAIDLWAKITAPGMRLVKAR